MINAMIYRLIVIGIGILLFAAGILDIKSRQISRKMIVFMFLACCALLPFRRYFSILTQLADWQSDLVLSVCQCCPKSRLEKVMEWWSRRLASHLGRADAFSYSPQPPL